MKKKFGVWLALLTALLGFNSSAMAGGGPVLTVAGTRAMLVLAMSSEPVTEEVRYYETGQLSEQVTQTVWVESSGVWTTTLSARTWTAFKVANGDYTADVQSFFWQDSEPDQTGWIERSIVTPTLVVSGTAGLVELVAWGIWGDEPLEYWELGVHKTLEPQWEEVAPDTYRKVLSDIQQWESFKIMTWPDLQVESQSPNWTPGSAPGWVVQVEPPPPPPPPPAEVFKFYLPFMGR